MKKIKQFFDTNFNRVNPKWNIYISFLFFIIFILPWILQIFNTSNKFIFIWASFSFLFLFSYVLNYFLDLTDKPRKRIVFTEHQLKIIIFILNTIKIVKDTISRIYISSLELLSSIIGIFIWILIIGGIIGILIFGWKQIL